MQGPEAGGPTMCGLHGQAYIAGTAIAEYLRDGHYLKLACTRRGASPVAMHARR